MGSLLHTVQQPLRPKDGASLWYFNPRRKQLPDARLMFTHRLVLHSILQATPYSGSFSQAPHPLQVKHIRVAARPNADVERPNALVMLESCRGNVVSGQLLDVAPRVGPNVQRLTRLSIAHH